MTGDRPTTVRQSTSKLRPWPADPREPERVRLNRERWASLPDGLGSPRGGPGYAQGWITLVATDGHRPARWTQRGVGVNQDLARSVLQRQEVWVRLADLCHSTKDAVGEVHALSEAALLPTVTPEDIGEFANRLNNRIRELKGRHIEDAWSEEVRALLERVISAMEKRLGDLSATSCSRLAWLHLNVGNEDRARDVAKIGVQRDPSNEHCQNLMRRLGI